MKLFNIRLMSLVVLSSIFIISCSQKEISSDKLQERNGIYFAVNEDNPYSGKVTNSYDNDQKKFEKVYKNGELNGLSTGWYENGQKKWEAEYKNSKLDGKSAKWYSSGQNQFEKEYADGELNGISIKWYSNGQKKSEIAYKSDQLSGNYKTWYENGQQVVKGKNKSGKMKGNWTYWDSNGNKEQEVEYADGKIVAVIQNGKKLTFGKVTDIDGNVYSTIKIGNQEWMAENLKVTHYRNGDLILNVTNNSKWEDLKTGAYCNYDNSLKNTAIYGSLYNWYAVKDKRGLAPKGWHIPTDKEWTDLENYLGSNASGKLKARGSSYWASPNEGATNASGFTALPGGYRYYDGYGAFDTIGVTGNWWSSTQYYSDSAWYRSLHYGNSEVSRSYLYKRSGFSVRCVRD